MSTRPTARSTADSMNTTPNPVRTLGYEERPGLDATVAAPSAAAPRPADTVAAVSAADTVMAAVSSADTLAAPSISSMTTLRTTGSPAPARTTVLPRVEGDGHRLELVVDSLTRYEPMKLLGKGGMGEVVLVKDQDIARTVALKRLLPEAQDPALLARFVDEIRTVGRLEHPNIVPIHDVGIDELGRYFFVMKYVEGETLESVIAKLKAGDKEYERKYSFEQRIEVFLGILHALEFAHANGVVHRDLKPANVMIGRYGEIILMDWGISKPLAQARDAASSAAGELAVDGDDKDKARLFATRVGSLIGTPAYMSPEQARGDIAKIDERSDLYSAVVLFHELVSLQHYLHDKQTLEQMLHSCVHEEFGFMKILGLHGSTQGPPPGELIHFTHKGLSKDPAKRFQSAAEMIQRLQEILAGEVKVQCHITFTKSTFRRFGRLVDRKPHLALMALLCMFAGVIFSAVTIVRMVV